MAINLFGGMPWITQSPTENLQRATQLGLGTGQLFGQSLAAGQRAKQEREELTARTQEAEARRGLEREELGERQRQFNLLGGLRKAQTDQALAAIENYKLDTELKTIQKQNEVANKQGLVHLFTLQKDTKGQGWTPENRAKLFAIGEQYPSMATHPYYKDIWDEIQEVDAGKQKLADQRQLEQDRLRFTVGATDLTPIEFEALTTHINTQVAAGKSPEQSRNEWFKANKYQGYDKISDQDADAIYAFQTRSSDPNERVVILTSRKDTKTGKVTEVEYDVSRRELWNRLVTPTHRQAVEETMKGQPGAPAVAAPSGVTPAPGMQTAATKVGQAAFAPAVIGTVSPAYGALAYQYGIGRRLLRQAPYLYRGARELAREYGPPAVKAFKRSLLGD